MIDTKSSLVLKILINECPNGSFHIIEGKDIISSLPLKYRVDFEGLENILNYLERKDFISIKYDDDDGVYCLCVLPSGNEYFENLNKQKREDKKSSLLWRYILINSITTFLFGFVGAVIAYLILSH